MPPVGVTTGPVPEIDREALAGEDVGVGRMVDEFDEAGGELIGAELDEFDETDDIDEEAEEVEVDFDDDEDTVVVDDFDEAGFGGPRRGDDTADIDVGIDEMATVVSTVVVLTVVVVSSPIARSNTNTSSLFPNVEAFVILIPEYANVLRQHRSASRTSSLRTI